MEREISYARTVKALRAMSGTAWERLVQTELSARLAAIAQWGASDGDARDEYARRARKGDLAPYVFLPQDAYHEWKTAIRGERSGIERTLWDAAYYRAFSQLAFRHKRPARKRRLQKPAA